MSLKHAKYLVPKYDHTKSPTSWTEEHPDSPGFFQKFVTRSSNTGLGFHTSLRTQLVACSRQKPGGPQLLRSRYFSFPRSEGLVPRGQCGFQLPSPILQGCFLASLLVPTASSWVSMQQSLRQGLWCGKCFWGVLLNADGDAQVKEFAMGVGLGFQGKALPPREGKAKGGGIPFLMVGTVPSVPSWNPGRCGFQPTGTAYWHVFGAVINLCVKGVP